MNIASILIVLALYLSVFYNYQYKNSKLKKIIQEGKIMYSLFLISLSIRKGIQNLDPYKLYYKTGKLKDFTMTIKFVIIYPYRSYDE